MDQANDLDAWSITISYQATKYMQSYFLVLRKNVFQEKFFIDFFKNIGDRKDKIDYIIEFELGFSKLIIKNKCKIGAYCRIRVYDLIISNLVLKLKLISLKLFNTQYRNWIKSFGDKNKGKTLIQKISSKIKILCNPIATNPSLIMPIMMIKKYRMPLVKVMLFRDNPHRENLKKVEQCIKQNTNYDFSLIENHQKRTRK
jgi:lipopolysaccharide biosynthesis protein